MCFPLSVLASSPRSQGVFLTFSIKSRINTYLESAGLPVPEAPSRQATPPPTTTHNDPAKNMKRLVNQKLSDFNIKGAHQTLSGNSSFANPNEESLNTLQQKYSQAPDDLRLPPSPDADTLPICFSTAQIHAANLFLSSWFKGRPRRPTATTSERLHLHHSRWCQHFSPHQLNGTSQLLSKWSSADWPQAFPLWRPTSWAFQKQRRPQTHCRRMYLPTSWSPNSA